MHKKIRKFTQTGEYKSDSQLVKVRDQQEAMLIYDMRERGYVPLLEFGPFWTSFYIEKDDKYEFILSVYGAHVGEKEAWEIEGITQSGKPLRRVIPQTR